VNIFSHTFTIGLQGTEGQFEQIYTGTNADQFDNTSYLFTYTAPKPEEPIAPDCTTNPAYINCIIQSVSTPDIPTLADTSNDSENTVEQPVVADLATTVIGGEALSLEELLAIADSATVDTKKEEKEKELADSITADILEQVLATNTTETEQRRDNNSTTTEEETVVQTIVENTVTENVETVVEETSLVVDNTTETQTTVENVENVLVAETIEETKTEEITEDTELLAQTVSKTIEETSSTETSFDENEMSIVVQQQQTTVEEITVAESNTEEVTELQVVETSINQSIDRSLILRRNVLDWSRHNSFNWCTFCSSSAKRLIPSNFFRSSCNALVYRSHSSFHVCANSRASQS
jgi:hypothetical protein